MEKNISKELIKRIKTDKNINIFVSGILVMGAMVYLLRFITTILAHNYDQNSLQEYASNFVKMGFIAAALVILSIILSQICKTGKPFTPSITKKFKCMAVLLIIATPFSMLASSFAGYIDPTATTSGFTFTFADIMIMIFGVIIGIISEIFYYGTRLEEEMDMIA